MAVLPYIVQGAPLALLAGARRRLRPAAPAAGQEFSIAVPGGEDWLIERGVIRLTTSAAVANRQFRLQVLDPDGVVVWQVATNISFAASVSGRLSFASDGPLVSQTGLGVALPLPAAPLPAGYRLATVTGALDAADQLDQVALDVLAITVGADGVPLGRPDEYLSAATGGEGSENEGLV